MQLRSNCLEDTILWEGGDGDKNKNAVFFGTLVDKLGGNAVLSHIQVVNEIPKSISEKMRTIFLKR
jgi:hypothetical protein